MAVYWVFLVLITVNTEREDCSVVFECVIDI